MKNFEGWIGVDLDGTLAHYDKWHPDGGVGEPIPAMLDRVKGWLKEGKKVKIITARVNPKGIDHESQIKIIETWCRTHIGEILDVCCCKDLAMIELWDDRAIQVGSNTGESSVANLERLLRDETASKNFAYGERNKLVAGISRLYPASLERHPDEDANWENDWRWIVFVDLPSGQCTWHIHDSHLPLFSHLPRLKGRKWDGHSTAEKYDRVAKISYP